VSKSTANISVIIPAYNRAGLIGETLRSLLNQTVQAKEVIIVDDGSQDGTAEKTLEAFENWKLETGNWKNDDGEQVSGNSTSNIPNPTLKILRQANAGPGAARNRGLAEATGEFIHFFDSDDIAAPNKQEVQLRVLLDTGADIAYGPWVKGRFAPKEAQTVARLLAHGLARGSLPLAAQTARVAGATEATELGVASLNSGNTRYQLPATLYLGFTPEGPVLQARGLPEGDLIKALLTNWSIVPHACLFRRSILEKAGGFPEDIWVGEDQLLFLRCLLAAAKVVHTPGTMVYYRVGDEGKLTESREGQQRRVVDWGKFLVKASEEVGGKAEKLKSEMLNAPATHYQLPVTATPSAWFGFRLRAYEAWRDLRAFFPGEYLDLETGLQAIWKRNGFSVFGFQVSGFLMRKLGGLKQRLVGHRWSRSFRCELASETSLESLLK
jgi:GT2 family glycosyltransferase